MELFHNFIAICILAVLSLVLLIDFLVNEVSCFASDLASFLHGSLLSKVGGGFEALDATGFPEVPICFADEPDVEDIETAVYNQSHFLHAVFLLLQAVYKSREG